MWNPVEHRILDFCSRRNDFHHIGYAGTQVLKMRLDGKRNSIFGLIAGGLLSLFGRKSAKAGLDDLKRADFTTSTQRLGIRFSEKIRDVFRFRWLRASRGTSPDVQSRSDLSDEPRGN